MKTEYPTLNAAAYGKNCIGCQRHNRDVMLSFIVSDHERPNLIINHFLTKYQARKLAHDIMERIKLNEEQS